MSNRFAAAQAWLSRMRQAHAVETMVYRRGEEAIEIEAWLGARANVADAERGVVLSEVSQVIGFAADQLVLGGAVARPQAGDVIERVAAGMTGRYRVTPTGDVTRGASEDCYQLDPHGIELAVFTIEQ